MNKKCNKYETFFTFASENDYKIMKLETLSLGLDRYLQKLKKHINDRLELAPAKMPDDLKEWIHKVGEWYRKDYEPKNRYSYYWQ